LALRDAYAEQFAKAVPEKPKPVKRVAKTPPPTKPSLPTAKATEKPAPKKTLEQTTWTLDVFRDRNFDSRDFQRIELKNKINYSIDGNQSNGMVELEFENTAPFSGTPEEAILIVKVSDTINSSSFDGFSVRSEGREVGINKMSGPGELLEIPLKVNSIPWNHLLTLTLETDVTDGTRIKSKKSGHGAKLRLKYPAGATLIAKDQAPSLPKGTTTHLLIAKKKAEEEAARLKREIKEVRRAAEAQRLKEEDERRLAEERKRRAEAERKAKEEAQRVAEAKRRAEEERKAKAEKKLASKPASTSSQTATNTFPTTPIDVHFRLLKTRPDDIAVIIANADYKKLGRDIPNVTPAYADAAGIRQYFMKAKGVREGNIIHIKDATGSQLIGVFGNERSHKGQLFNWVRPNVSNVYVYYAGHGAPALAFFSAIPGDVDIGGDEGSAYLIPSDATSETVDLTGYPLATLYKNLGKIPAKSVTVILEACFSGTSQTGSLIPRSSGITIVPKVPLVPTNVTVISAGAANQIASWEKDEKHSLFTKYFLKSMSGEGDKKPYGNGDGKVTYKELGKYLEGTMTYFARRYYGRDQKAQIVSGG
jgi:hypothetical protein